MKNKTIIIALLCAVALTSCNKQPMDNPELTEAEETIKPDEKSDTEDDSEVDNEIVPEIKTTDYSEYFGELSGCAVIYSSEEQCYYAYNQGKINTEVSPYSTFKIVGTLMGLNNHIIEDENSLMNYNGTAYPVEAWNENLTLKEAFQTSCIWYFRQVIDQVGYEEVEKELRQLNYGNCDISQWKGSNMNPLEGLNGFWLGSSLKISPMEQVQVIKNIFQGQTIYSQSQIEILKEIMLYDNINGYSIYGKTGTNQNMEGWYVGIANKDHNDFYFAVYLDEGDSESPASGQAARDIVLKIFDS